MTTVTSHQLPTNKLLPLINAPDNPFDNSVFYARYINLFYVKSYSPTVP